MDLQKGKLLLNRVLTYYPLRYYFISSILAYFFLSNFVTVQSIEEQMIKDMLNFFGFSSTILDGTLFVGDMMAPSKITLAIYTQLLFLTFFPTIALSARITLKKRAKFLSFTFLYFFTSTILQFLAIALLLSLGISVFSSSSYKALSIGIVLISGSLFIEFALFSNITIPTPTKLKPLLKRNYFKEYLYLMITIITSIMLIYLFITFVSLDFDSRFAFIIHLQLWLNVSTIVFFAILLSNVLYEIRWPSWLKYSYSLKSTFKPPSVSFLIPAYNEEKIVGRCIESIDKAASKYPGKTEIILVDDGSTDNTAKVVADAMGNLRHCTGQLLRIPNSGKGFALKYGLERISGDIIFRTDADSVMDENILSPMMHHYKDPEVGSVCGWVFPLEEKSAWQKAQCVLCANYLYTKRGQEIVDSIITQPGSCTSFRKEAILKSGGWIDNIFGEDGEITNRIARLGYRGVIEQRSIVYTEHPETLKGFMQQRARWGVAYFHSRGRNLRILRDNMIPRSFIFLWNLVAHSLGLGKNLAWPYLLASITTGSLNLSLFEIPIHVLIKLASIQLIITLILIILYAHRLNKIKKAKYIIYFPFIRIINLMLNLIVKPQVIEILLSWSIKWKEYNDESFKALRKEVNQSIDPLYPPGEVDKQSYASVKE